MKLKPLSKKERKVLIRFVEYVAPEKKYWIYDYSRKWLSKFIKASGKKPKQERYGNGPGPHFYDVLEESITLHQQPNTEMLISVENIPVQEAREKLDKYLTELDL